MSVQNKQVAAAHVDENHTLILHGALTRFTVARLWSGRKSWTLTDNTRVDVSDVAVIDTAGVAFLLEVMKLIGDGNGPLTCLGASNQLKQIARVSGVESLLSLS